MDVRYAWRGLAKAPLASSIGVLSLAAGIGVTSIVYSVLDGLFLRPLPCEKPQVVVRIEAGGFSYPEYEELRRQCRGLSGVLAETGHGSVLRDGERSHFVLASSVSPNFFSVLGLQAGLGQLFAERADGRSERVAVISDLFWRRFFGGDTNVVGRAIRLGETPLVVVGVAPRGFTGVGRYFALDIWYPDDVTTSRDPAMRYSFRAYTVMGRLAPGVSRLQAQAEVETIVRRVMAEGQTRAWDQPVRVLSEAEYGWDQGGLVMLMVMPVVGLVLLVACANVSSLLLARNEQRRKELALRAALGASRTRLIRQLLTESLIMAMGGLALALPLTYVAVGPVSRVLLSGAAAGSIAPSLPVDHRALIASFVLGLAATMAAGWLPALRSARTDLGPILKGDIPVLGSGRWRFAGRNLLVVGQLALALVFLAATGLLMIGFQKVIRMDPGFAARELLIISFYGMHNRPRAEAHGYYRQLSERLEAVPGILRVSLAVTVPYADARNSLERTIFVPTVGLNSAHRRYEVRGNIVGTNYFETLGIPRLRGRTFVGVDRAPRVAIVSERLARTAWPDWKRLAKRFILNDRTVIRRPLLGWWGIFASRPRKSSASHSSICRSTRSRRRMRTCWWRPAERQAR